MSGESRIAVFADFDDTLTTRNVAHFLLRRFAPEALERFSKQYRAGEITFREYQERCFDAVTAPVEELQEAAAENIELRPGLSELLEAVDSAGGTFTVASAGLDIYIEPVLRRHGLQHLGVVCGTATRHDSERANFGYDYPFGDAGEEPCRGDWATCKCKALTLAGDGATTVFVGDGSTSDACAAPKADHVFARDRLLRICNENGVTATPFEDFSPVTELVKQLSTEPQAIGPEQR